MAQLIEKVNNKVNYLKRLSRQFHDQYWIAKKNYIKYYEKLDIDEKGILFESQHGREMSGNIFYMLKYLSNSQEYKEFKIYLSACEGKVEIFNQLLELYGIFNVKIVVLASNEYFKTLASAKYLVNDNTFLPFFMKKEGQVYINTWHGTPLKSLGRKIKNDAHAIGNAQKNFVSADYLLFPNEHTKDAILEDYMAENISEGSYIMAGYPRNEIFFDKERRVELKEKFALSDKKVYAYMPTFRGIARNGRTKENENYLNECLKELDMKLQESEVLYVNLHPIAKDEVDFTQFKHIKKFPSNYETYDFLNVADALVTDYSSVFFDYANTKRKIILFTYDKEEYLSTRGTYMSIDELPFPQVRNVEELLVELRSEKAYNDQKFIERFCKYESVLASQKLCDYIFLDKDTGLNIYEIPNNEKENVLIYVGNLAGNGITASFRNLMNNIDLSKRNYYFAFKTNHVAKVKETIFTFPSDMYYFAISEDSNITLKDMFWRKAFNMNWISADTYMKNQEKRVHQELERKFGKAKFDRLIHFSGYETDIILEFSTFEGQNTIYVHSNMLREIETKGNQRRDVLKYAYNCYDNVAVVTEDMINPTVEISGKCENIKTVKNIINYKNFIEKSKYDITFDDTTKTSMEQGDIIKILKSESECFINVGRFAPEKAHGRLVLAFAKYNLKHPDSYLIIMGGYSLNQGYEKLFEEVKRLHLEQKIILIENVSNPYPIIKECDYFVLGSLYEGFGLVLAEADALGLPVISTDILGPRGFMEKHGGKLVENSEEGLYIGMEMLHSGNVEVMDIDYEAYNEEAVMEFEGLF